MIAFERVCKTYPGGHVALHDVSFRIPHGRMAFLTGPSGSGKSSLLRLIPQIDLPSSGKVLINDMDIARVGAWRIPRLRRHIGVIFQNPHLLNEWSVFDNIALPLRVQHYPREEIVRRVRAAVGQEFIIIYRLSMLDLVEEGSDWKEIEQLAIQVEHAGATLINTGIGWHEARIPTIATMVPRAGFSWVTRRLMGKVSIPLITTNRINHPDVAEAVLADGCADMVSMARPFLADAAFV